MTAGPARRTGGSHASEVRAARDSVTPWRYPVGVGCLGKTLVWTVVALVALVLLVPLVVMAVVWLGVVASLVLL